MLMIFATYNDILHYRRALDGVVARQLWGRKGETERRELVAHQEKGCKSDLGLVTTFLVVPNGCPKGTKKARRG